MSSIDNLKAILDDNPDFTLNILKEGIPELKAQWSFDERITIPILRKVMEKYDEFDEDDLQEMYCNPDFFDEEFDVKDNEATVEKIIELIQYWKYENHVGIFVVESKKKK